MKVFVIKTFVIEAFLSLFLSWYWVQRWLMYKCISVRDIYREGAGESRLRFTVRTKDKL